LPSPYQASVAVETGGASPPNASAAVEVPELPISSLAVFISCAPIQLVPFQDSTLATNGSPPKIKPVETVPTPPNSFLATFTSLTSVQLVPFQDSVLATAAAGGPSPVANKADVLSAPKPAASFLAVLRSFTSVQADPFQDSTIPVVGGIFPPIANADVEVPAPGKVLLAVFKSAISVQV